MAMIFQQKIHNDKTQRMKIHFIKNTPGESINTALSRKYGKWKIDISMIFSDLH